MGEQQGGAPAWAPASVKSAPRHGTASADDLRSGAAWERFLEGLRGAAAPLLDPARRPADDRALAHGYRHLLVLLALGLDEALRHSDPYDPHLRPGNVDDVLKWGMDCPDALYLGASVRADATYRVRGTRGSVRYLGLQVMGGMESTANLVVDDLELGSDGSFEVVLSAREHPGNWLPLDERASTLIVRQFFYDWAAEEPADLQIELVERDGGPTPPPAPPVPDAQALARQLEALGGFVGASLEFWRGIEEAGRAAGLNVFREPAARTDMGGAAENVTVWGSWELDEDEALVIEVTPPPARYWSVALGDPWWASIDYANRQSSLNGHQAHLDDDGTFRAVVAHRDPGVANWLDTAGHRDGPMIFRWVRADDAPVAATRVVAVDRIDDELPDAPRVTPEQRAATIAARRAGVRRRFRR